MLPCRYLYRGTYIPYIYRYMFKTAYKVFCRDLSVQGACTMNGAAHLSKEGHDDLL